MQFTIAFERRFSMAHRLLSGASGKCMVPHGHNEFVRVFLSKSKPSQVLDGQDNMLIPFDAVKKKWHGFIDGAVDHALQLSEADPLLRFFRKNEPHHLKRLLVTPGDPTTEMVAACLMNKLQAFVDEAKTNLRCVRLELQETPTNTVVLEGEDWKNEPLIQNANQRQENFWWNRADYSINDLEVG